MAAFYSATMFSKLAFFSGENLQALLKDINYYIDVMKTLNNKNSLPYLLQLRETVSILIDKGQHTESQSNAETLCEGVSSCTAEVEKWQEGMLVNRTLQAFWCGHAQRCNHYATKMTELQSVNTLNKLIISFVSIMAGMIFT